MSEILPNVERRELSYGDYRRDARDCDILLWEPTSWYGHVIAVGTDGPFSHVSSALWWSARLMSVGYEEGKDGVVEPLRSVVRRFPNKLSIFRVKGPFDREAVKDRMIRDLGGKYQWCNIRLIALMNFPFIRWIKATPAIRRRIAEASHKTAGGICSQFIARSFSEDEVSFVRKHYSVTTPNDLGNSPKVDYLGTLV